MSDEPAHRPDEIAEELTQRDEYDSVLVIASGEDVTDVGANITRRVEDSRTASLWLSAVALWHTAKTAQDAGGDATVSDVAIDAVGMLDEATGGPGE